jgi:hypothetical protein
MPSGHPPSVSRRRPCERPPLERLPHLPTLPLVGHVSPHCGSHVSTEIPISRSRSSAAVKLALDLQRLNGEVSRVMLLFPDEISALTLKAFATTVRMKATGVERLLPPT